MTLVALAQLLLACFCWLRERSRRARLRARRDGEISVALSFDQRPPNSGTETGDPGQ